MDRLSEPQVPVTISPLLLQNDKHPMNTRRYRKTL